MPHRAGKVLDLVLRLRDGGLDGDDILHALGLFQKLLQPLELDLRRFEARLRIVIPLADVLRRVALPCHMAKRADLRAEVRELLGGHAHGVACVAVAAGVIREILLLKVAAHALYERGNVLRGLIKFQRLHLDARGVDHLDAALGKVRTSA